MMDNKVNYQKRKFFKITSKIISCFGKNDFQTIKRIMNQYT